VRPYRSLPTLPTHPYNQYLAIWAAFHNIAQTARFPTCSLNNLAAWKTPVKSTKSAPKDP
jgi:hypothetical protein